MNKKNKPIRILFAGLASFLLAGAAAASIETKALTLDELLDKEVTEVKPKRLYSKIARIVADGLPQAHVNHAKVSDDLAVKAFDLFLDSLDYDRTYFLQSDVDRFQEKTMSLDDFLVNGELQFAYDVFNLFKKRVRDRATFVDQLLDQEMDFEQKETYLWKRKDADRADSKETWDDLWRRKVKNEMVGYKVNRIMAEEKAAEEEAEAREKAANGNEEAEVDEEDTKDKQDEDVFKLTPDERIRKRYRQLLTVIDGHDSEWVLQLFLNAFAQAYDAHTSYLSPRANEDFDINMKLSLTGIGAVLNVEDGAAKIVRLIAGGPAEKDGRLQPGDKIVGVAQGAEEDEVDILYWPLYKSVRLIRGEKGSTVVLSVVPASDVTGSSVKKIDLVREEIKLEERAAKLDIKENPRGEGEKPYKLGILTLPDFYADLSGMRRGIAGSRSCSRDVKVLLQEANEENIDGLILDLRNNGGGSLQEAIELTGFFIDRGPIVQVKGNRRVNVLRDPNNDVVYSGPLVVLVNRMSASASEILAGALQDHGRALIIGDTKTHGKGTVQSVFPLDQGNPDLGALKVTTAGFYRVDGRSTQLKGVEPDIIMSSAYDVMEIGEEYLSNVLDWSWVAAAEYTPDTHLKGLVDDLRKRTSERQENNDRFQAYQSLVERLEERNNMTVIPLDLEDRLKLARKDKALDDLREKMGEELSTLSTDSEEKDEEKAFRRDVIMQETLLILKDIIELEAPASPSLATK